ncbi:MAG: hypothetical protein GXP51_12425 [Deltaproteobacteria bacterium]|nr:hypothetical protein [Deltaproteobacteria bacterium]
MGRWFFYGILLLLAGCSWGKYQIPKQDYQAKVQVLGVLPLLIDSAAPFDYPQKEALLDMLARSAVGKHEVLVERLREKKGYFDVRALSGNPGLIAASLLTGKNPPDEIGRPQGYRFNRAAVAELSQRNVVDALLVVVFSGARIKETRRSRTLLESLKTKYNDIVATAAVVDRNGEVLWRLSGDDTYRALQLQYPDFDEAYFNRTDLVRVKNIRLSGVEKALNETSGRKKEGRLPKMYDKLFDRIVSGISPGLLDSL